MKLSELVKGLGEFTCCHGDVEAFHITHDSRLASPGCVFVAIEGSTHDGHDHVACALQQGCIAVVTAQPGKVKSNVPILAVSQPRLVMAQLAKRLYGEPDGRLRTIGVTGTNGKTTTTYLIQQLLAPIGLCGRIGTLTVFNGSTEERALRTTPESPQLFRSLAEMVQNGCSHAVLEISSHALSLGRVHGLSLATALFTNLTQDHLDFHRDMESYFQAKCTLFDLLKSDGLALFNGDDPWCRRARQALGGRCLSFGTGADCELRIEDLHLAATGCSFTACHAGQRLPVRLPLLGAHNALNFAGAALAVLGEGLSLEEICAAAARLKPPAGRLEAVVQGQPFGLAVDFAHSPDALSKICACCRQVTDNRLIVVFGAGGDRDQSKRPAMAAAVEPWADIIILTQDNPRNEDPERILDQVQAGFTRCQGPSLLRIGDRAQAIAAALDLAQPGDFVLLAGKGHETTQEVRGEHRPFNDREEALRHLKEKGY